MQSIVNWSKDKRFTVIITPFEADNGYTIAVEELDTYGEGSTIEEAKEDLLFAIRDYLDVYTQNIVLFTKMAPLRKQEAASEMMSCADDAAILTSLGLRN